MSEKATPRKTVRFRKVTEEDGISTVIKIEKTDAGVRTVKISNKVATESFEPKMKGLTAGLATKLNASLERSNSKADLLAPPKNPNRRPTRINADRSLSRMKARDRALVGRGH